MCETNLFAHTAHDILCVCICRDFFNSNCPTTAAGELMRFLLCARLIAAQPPQTLRLAMDCAPATDCAVAQPSVRP